MSTPPLSQQSLNHRVFACAKSLQFLWLILRSIFLVLVATEAALQWEPQSSRNLTFSPSAQVRERGCPAAGHAIAIAVPPAQPQRDCGARRSKDCTDTTICSANLTKLVASFAASVHTNRSSCELLTHRQ